MPHDEVVVLLDAHEQAVVGESFDVQVRAAARSCAPTRCAAAAPCHVASSRRRRATWRRSTASRRVVLELLATAEPTGTEPVARFLDRDGSAASQAAELVVVTGLLDARLTDALLERAFARRPTALVLVEASSWLREGGSRPDPALLRLDAAGVPIAAIRKGDDLAVKLSGFEEERGPWLGLQSSPSASASSSSGTGPGSRSLGKHRPTLLMVLLGTAPALLPTFRWRLGAAGAALPSRANRARGVASLVAREVADRAVNGFLDFYDVLVPFDAVTHPLMHGVFSWRSSSSRRSLGWRLRRGGRSWRG